MKNFPLVLAIACLVPFTPSRGADETAVKLPPKQEFQLFLLAGQSNMAGRGKVDDEGRKPQPRIYSLNKDGKWQPAVDPLHWDKPEAGAGIGKPFAEIIASKNPSISIGLVPTACGGSPISTWSPGKFWEQTKSHPYDDFLVRAKRAMQDGTLKAILWHQGESDSNAMDAAEYETRLTELINRMRSDLNAPDLPFIIGQLGRFPAKPWSKDREAVDAAHQAVARKMKNVRFVSSEGLNSRGDNLHFDTPSLRIFAHRYAEAYLQVAGGGKP
jgi:carbohydrate esterase-like sialic acid-specific acetylesterase